MTDTKPKAAADDAAHMREMRLQRNMKIVVTVLGLAIIGGLAAVANRAMNLPVNSSSSSSASAPASSLAAAPATTTTLDHRSGRHIALELPKGAKVVSSSIGGNRLAVHYESPTGTGIAVIDIDSGRVIADVQPREGVPRD